MLIDWIHKEEFPSDDLIAGFTRQLLELLQGNTRLFDTKQLFYLPFGLIEELQYSAVY